MLHLCYRYSLRYWSLSLLKRAAGQGPTHVSPWDSCYLPGFFEANAVYYNFSGSQQTGEGVAYKTWKVNWCKSFALLTQGAWNNWVLHSGSLHKLHIAFSYTFNGPGSFLLIVVTSGSCCFLKKGWVRPSRCLRTSVLQMSSLSKWQESNEASRRI